MSSPEPVRSLGELAALDPATRDARELEWFARVRTGDAQAFEALFRAYVDPLCSFAYSYVESESQAQEIVQDLFARLWERRETLERPRSVRAYLYGATRNRVLNERRHARVEAAFRHRALRLEAAQATAPRPVPPEEDLHRHGQRAGMEILLGRAGRGGGARSDRAAAALPRSLHADPRSALELRGSA